LVTAWRLLVFEPGPDVSFELWRNLSIALAIFLIIPGTPIALLGLAIGRRLAGPGAAARWLILALELAGGLIYTLLVIGGPLGAYPLIYPVVHLLPWLIFGLVAGR
jgi:hypothetical protein